MGRKNPKKEKPRVEPSWSQWLLKQKKALSLQNDQNQDSNFIAHDRTSQGFAGSPSAFNPGVLPKPAKQRKKSRK